ncbi:MAG: urate hydroxylase PuuD [Myxococcaceae bacterium]|nr:urate hydroxylase PuuD [Myxococcaceae bacterium]
MLPFIQEWANLLVRWVHVVAAIMWIGDSFLFMWLDSHLTAPTKPREGDVGGELWMTHSGGFYEVIKRKSLAKHELPATLYWFKWESYTTWITGTLLLIIVYYLNAQAYLVDTSVADISPTLAIALSVLSLPMAYGVYAALWRTPLARNPKAFAAVGFFAVLGLAYLYTHLFSGRAAFLQVGATLGSVMAFSVFSVIIPGQRKMLAATEAGQKVDVSHGLRAKGRSIHNHYLTLPVLFTMLSNHFPSLYGHSLNWLVLGLVAVVGVSLKYVMNYRSKSHPIAYVTLLGPLLGVMVMTRPQAVAAPASAAYANLEKVSFDDAHTIIQARCVTCHSAHPTHPMFPMAPNGVLLDSPGNIAKHADRIFVRTVETKTMPLGNLTGITDDERTKLGSWFAHGASVVGAGPAAALTPEEEAKNRFQNVCVTCHGAAGDGKGPSAAALPTQPRDYTDAAWQAKTTDDEIRKIVLEGGPAVGKSALMPPSPDLKEKPLVLDALVKIVRGFKRP